MRKVCLCYAAICVLAAFISGSVVTAAVASENLHDTGFGKTYCTGVPRLHVTGDFLYAAGENGIFRHSKEDGAEWQPFAMAGWNVVDFCVCGVDIVAIIVPEEYKGHDIDMRPVCRLVKGTTGDDGFRDITPDGMTYQYQGDDRTYLSRLAQHPDVASTISVMGHGGIYISDDFGDSWRNVSYFSATYNAHSFLGWHPYNPQVMFMTSESAIYEAVIYRSDDGGATWDVIVPENNGDSSCHQLAFDPTDHDRILAAGECCIWESLDCGRSWHYIYSNDDEFDYAYNVLFDPSDSNRWYVMEAHSYYPHRGIYSSSDNGLTWSKVKRFEYADELDAVYYDAILFNNRIYFHGREDVSYYDLGQSAGTVNVPEGYSPEDAEYYNLQGVRLDRRPASGMYIRKCGSKADVVVF